MEIGQISFRKPIGWKYSVGSGYSNIRNALHFFTKQVHPQMFIGIVVKAPDVYGGFYRVTIKKYFLKVPYYVTKAGEIPIDIVNNIEIIDEIDNPYPMDVKRMLLNAFKKYGRLK